jgi:hypothetical protein
MCQATNPDPSQTAFWRNHLLDGTLFEAIREYPEDAKFMFGELPVSHGNLLQLGMILGAREILAAPSAELETPSDAQTEEELRLLVDALPDDAKSVAREYFSPGNRVELLRKFARKIIKDATGFEPS